MENINIWRAMEATLEADNVAGAPDSNSNDDNRRPRLTLPPIVIFSNLISRQLILISIFTILFNMVQLVCQACLLIRSKRLVTSLLNSCTVCWTFLILVLMIRWLAILNRNKTEIMYRGKIMVVGCQLLSMLNFVSMFAVFCFENFDNSTESWSLTLFEGLPYFLSRTINNDIKWMMCSMICCNCLNTLLFIVIIFYIRKGRTHIQQVMTAWLWQAIYQHIQNNATQPNAAHNASDYILRTFNRNPNELLSKDLEFSAPAA